MKKLLLALPLLALPLTAMAQDKPEMSQSTLEAAKKRFEPTFCSNNVGKMAKALNECYLKIAYDPTDPQYQQCLLGDMFLIGKLDATRQVSIEEGKPDPYPNLPSFLTRDSRKERIKRFFNILETKGYTPQEKVNYISKPSKEFDKYIRQSCNK